MTGMRRTPSRPCGQELSELDPEYREAPHQRLDELRNEAPRYLDPSSEKGRLFLTRHADVRAALVDRSLTRDAKKAYSRGAEAVPDTLLDKDGEDLFVARALMARAFDLSPHEPPHKKVTYGFRGYARIPVMRSPPLA